MQFCKLFGNTIRAKLEDLAICTQQFHNIELPYRASLHSHLFQLFRVPSKHDILNLNITNLILLNSKTTAKHLTRRRCPQDDDKYPQKRTNIYESHRNIVDSANCAESVRQFCTTRSHKASMHHSFS